MLKLEDLLRSKPDFHEDQIEQLAFELAYELEEAEMSRNDLVTVNRDKLRAIAERILSRLASGLLESTPAIAPISIPSSAGIEEALSAAIEANSASTGISATSLNPENVSSATVYRVEQEIERMKAQAKPKATGN